MPRRGFIGRVLGSVEAIGALPCVYGRGAKVGGRDRNPFACVGTFCNTYLVFINSSIHNCNCDGHGGHSVLELPGELMSIHSLAAVPCGLAQ